MALASLGRGRLPTMKLTDFENKMQDKMAGGGIASSITHTHKSRNKQKKMKVIDNEMKENYKKIKQDMKLAECKIIEMQVFGRFQR